MTAEPTGHPFVSGGTHDARQISRSLGVVLLFGGLLVLLGVSIRHWPGADVAGMYGVGAVALIFGAASIVWAKHARTWTIHAVFATGTTLICVGVYFSTVATGAYAVLFVWLVVMAASFFSPRAIAAHVLFILVASAVTLALVDTPDVSPVTRWTLGSLLLILAAVMMGRIAARRRSIEEQLRSEIEEKEALQRELQHLAHHDPLTGLANRRRFDEELSRELARAARQGAPLSVIALDLDDFKEYNDLHGHVAGDRLLKRLASGWALTVRTVDLVARLGGDEFVALLPDCPPEEAELVAQRLRRRVPPGVACSAGTACWDGRESAEELLTRADRAMYEAKRIGLERLSVARAPAAGM